ncbi:MAG: type II CAAX prenyl endopeptidase Rce1 family protein, partial [Chlamydiales bacterium]
VVKYVPNQNSLLFDFSFFNFDFIFFSCVLVYLREKTQSIWPGVLFHNIVNGLPILVAWLTY